MIPLPANVKAILVPILVAGAAALQAIENLNPAWTWASVGAGILLYLDGLFTVPGTQAQRDAHAKAAAS